QAASRARVEDLLPISYALAQNIYPDLLRRDVNRVPSWLPWWWRVPEWGKGKPSILSRLGQWLFVAVCFLVPCLAGLFVFALARSFLKEQWPDFYPDINQMIDQVMDGFLVAILAIAPFYCWFLARIYRAIPLLFSRRRRRMARWRKQLAALLSLRHRLTP